VSEIKIFVTRDLQKINDPEDASPMTLEFNRNKRISFPHILHCIYVIFFKELQLGFFASGTKITVTANRLRNMRSCKTYFCSSGIAERAQTRSVCFQKCIISHFHQYARGGRGGGFKNRFT